MDLPYSFRPAKRVPTLSARERVLAQWRRWDWSGVEKEKKITSKKVEQVLPQVLAGLRIGRRQSEAEVLKVWKDLIDPNIVAHARPTGIRNGTLFISVDSNVWLSEIVRYRRQEILDRLQSSFGPEFVSRISFRVG